MRPTDTPPYPMRVMVTSMESPFLTGRRSGEMTGAFRSLSNADDLACSLAEADDIQSESRPFEVGSEYGEGDSVGMRDNDCRSSGRRRAVEEVEVRKHRARGFLDVGMLRGLALTKCWVATLRRGK